MLQLCYYVARHLKRRGAVTVVPACVSPEIAEGVRVLSHVLVKCPSYFGPDPLQTARLLSKDLEVASMQLRPVAHRSHLVWHQCAPTPCCTNAAVL